MRTTLSQRRVLTHKAVLLVFFALLIVLGCRGATQAQSPPTGPAGGDLTGTYPNPTLAVDRVRKTGDTITGYIDISVPNGGGIPVPFTLSSYGNALLNRGTAMGFNIPLSGSTSLLGGKITSAWGTGGKTYMSFSAYNNGAFPEIFRMDSGGFFGIGTTNPTSKLHVVSGTDSATSMLKLDTGVHGGTAMTVAGTVNNESTFDLSVYRAGSYASRFGVSSAGNVYFQPGANNVGIGTTSPTNAKLHIFQAASGATEYTAGGYPELTLESNLNTDLHFLSPNAGSARIYFGSPAGNTVGAIYYMHNATVANGYMAFTANGERMRILGNGNVGIGTTAPASKLEVAGTIHSTTGGFKFPDGSVQTTAASGGGGGGSMAFSNITTGTNTVALVIGTGGSLDLIGTGAINATTLNGATLASPGAIGGTAPGAGTFTTISGNGASLSNLNASSLASGTVPILRLGTGTPDSTKFLRGDNTWTAITSSQWSAAGTNNINYGASGNVGIGVVTPSAKLDVNGNINVSGTGNITAAGTITGNIINAKYQDLAEWVPSSEQLSAGTVVVLDTTKSNQVVSANVPYDTRVAGVISAQPGITLGESGEGKVLVATTGRVRVKVDASRGPIQIGDLLVTSDVSGVAMKSVPLEFAGRKMHMPGTIIGKALEPLAKGSGEILVLLSLQ